ncbi:MAG: transglutaminase-like domain-containing protein [Tetrasphaera sp.]
MSERILISPDTSTGTTVRARSVLTGASLVDILLALGLLGVGVLAFGPVFGGARGYAAATIGVVLGFVIAVIARLAGWGVLTTAAAVLFCYILLGGAIALSDSTIAGVIPTLTTLTRLAQLLAQSWRDLLTVGIPADGYSGPAVVPFAAGLTAGALVSSLVLRGRQVAAVLTALAFLVVGILWGIKSAPYAVGQGVAFAVLTLVWAVLARGRVAGDPEAGLRTSSGWDLRRGGLAAAMIVLAVVAAAVLGPALLTQTNRHILRDDIVPPLDPRAYASPLTQYRHLVTDLKDDTLVTVTGLPEGDRVRLATLDTYDGIVYNVAASSASYVKVGHRVEVTPPSGKPTHLGVTVGKLAGPWLAGGGDIRQVDFTGAGAAEQAKSLYYNPGTGTALTSAGTGAGTAYGIDVVLPAQPKDKDLEQQGVRDIPLPANDKVPDIVAKTAATYTQGIARPYAQVRAIERELRQTGFFSDGSDGKSRAGHSADRINTFLSGQQLIGNDEQYAVAMALMVRSLDLPARVVMGFYPEAGKATTAPVALTGKDAHVWVEVAFEPDVWASFDPTPDHDRVPKTRTDRPKSEPKPQVLPPPDPPRSDVDRPTDVDTSRRPPASEPSVPVWHRVLKFGALVVAGLLLLAAPFVTILALKRRRRGRRKHASRSADRVSGGWAEILDHATDLGAPVPPTLTRHESAGYLGRTFPAVSAVAVADGVDSRVFGPDEPTAADIDALWREVDAVLAGMTGSVGRRRALRARFSLRSLRRRSGSARSFAGGKPEPPEGRRRARRPVWPRHRKEQC